MSKRPIRLFFAIDDSFPPWRLDIDELFAHQLAARGLNIVWTAKRAGEGLWQKVSYCGQSAMLPPAIAKGGLVRRLVNESLQLIFEFGLFFQLLSGKFDLIQIRDRRYFLALLAWVAARIKGVPFVYWLSYPYPEHILEMARQGSGLRRLLLRIQGSVSSVVLYRFLLCRADHVFVQSEQMLRDVTAYGIAPCKITPVPMGVPPKLLNWVVQQGCKDSVPGRIVYVGALARIRNLRTMIEAFGMVYKRFPSAQLIVVGDGDSPEDRASLEMVVRELGLQEAVTFTGFVPMEDAWDWAASAEVCISPIYPTPTLNAGSPTKLVEYLALGKPVVANEHPDQAQVLAQCPSGICVAWSAEAFADGICGLLTDPERARKAGALGPTWVATHRSYDILADQVFTKYQEILGR